MNYSSNTIKQGYKHDDNVIISEDDLKKSRKIGWITICLFLLALCTLFIKNGYTVIAFIISFISLVYWIIKKSDIEKSIYRIFIGPRYLVCGNKIIYLFSISSMHITPTVCILRSNTKELFKIERIKFTSVSTKAPKIKINLDRKYASIIQMLIQNISIENPSVKIEDNR